MAKLSSIFSKVNSYEDDKINYYAKHLVESYLLVESKRSKRFTTETVLENLFDQAMEYDTLDESLAFLTAVEDRINEGFTDFIKKAGKAAIAGVKKVATAVANAWSPYITAIKKWNIQINKIADKYQELDETKIPLLHNSYLIEEDKNTNADDDSDDEKENIKDNVGYLKILIKKSGVTNNADGFYDRMKLKPDKLFGAAGNFFKFGAKYQYDFITMLRQSSHKPASFKPMKDMEMYAYMANMTLLLTTIKAKKLIPPGEDQEQFLKMFIKPALKHTLIMNETINRETMEADGTNDEMESDGINDEITAPEEEVAADTSLIQTFTKANPTFVKKLKGMKDADKEKMIKAINVNQVDPKDLDAIVTKTDFLENGVNIAEKVRYIKQLQEAGLDNDKIISVLEYIVQDDIESSFHTNTTLMNVQKVAAALGKPGGLTSLADEIFDNTQL